MKKYLFAIVLLAPLALSAASKSSADGLKDRLTKLLPPGSQIDSIKPSGYAGMFEVVLGSEVFYVTADGRYMLSGDLIDLNNSTNLTEQRRGGIRKALIDGVDEKDMIIYGDAKAPRTITVFTDIDCGYCRKLHSEIDSYLQLGFRVRYLAYPRSGVGSDSYQKTVSVWCADDRKKALTLAKKGQSPERRDCANPVAAEFALGERVGVRGTPTIVLEDGRVLPGYVPAGRLLQLVNAR